MKKCSLLKHKENDAISFCQECRIFMCNKCENNHSEVLENHHIFKLEKNKDIDEIFTGFCKIERHSVELKYYCKTHNILCCAECITKLKDKDNGQHSDCNICFIKDIENEKRNKLKDNIKSLEDLSINLQQMINDIKDIVVQLDKNKEELKKNIQKAFTKLRNAINDREDTLLLEVDKKYNELFLNEEIIREIDKFPNKIKISLEKGKEIENNWNINKLNSQINECLNIENNIKDINKIQESVKKSKSLKFEFRFIPNEDGINQFLESIKNFGNIKNDPNKINFFNQSNIVKFDENELVLSWFNKKPYKAKILLDSKIDNDSLTTFMNKCEYNSSLIIFIKTKENLRFGGFCSVNWPKKGWKKDDKSFIFSLDRKEMYKANNSDYAIGKRGDIISFGADDGGYWDLFLWDNYLTKGGETWKHIYQIPENNQINNGKNRFQISNVEVYQLFFES